MTNDLLFEFTVDKATRMVYITREFDADQSLVWDAFTKAELIDQWIAPKPMVAKTKFYAMISLDGQERWALQEYTSITPKTNFKMHNVFTDKDETPEPYGSDWDHTFSAENGRTKVSISIYNESLERLERVLDGFTQGMKMALSNLEDLLITLSKNNKN